MIIGRNEHSNRTARQMTMMVMMVWSWSSSLKLIGFDVLLTMCRLKARATGLCLTVNGLPMVRALLLLTHTAICCTLDSAPTTDIR